MENANVDFRILFESLPGMYYVLTPDFIIVAVSDVFLKTTMTAREQLLGKFLFDVFPENPEEKNADGESTMRESLRYVLEHKAAHTMAVLKYDIRTPEGTYEEKYWSPANYPMIRDGKVVYILHQVKDVTDLMRSKQGEGSTKKYQLNEIATEYERELYQRGKEIEKINNDLLSEIAERKLAQEQARASQILLQATIESHKDLLIFSIDKNYRYLVFNSAFKESTLQAYGTIVEEGGSLLDTITNERDREKAKQNCDRALAGENHLTIEAFGEVNRFYFETRYTPVVDASGVINGITVQSSNITDRMIAEEQIRNLNKELESFTYSVAHDLRAPLRAIDGYSEILRQHAASAIDDEGKRLINVITKNAKTMGKLIDDLLEFSRMGRLPLRIYHVDMDALVRRVLQEDFVAHASKARIEIKTLEPTSCDGNLIQQVFTNLISNAIKYSRTRAVPVIELGSRKTNQEIVYYIKDNGVGFDMQYAEKLFGVFQRLHKASEFEGTGVGLAIVHRIIAKHSGRVWAESSIDHGATFYFALPT